MWAQRLVLISPDWLISSRKVHDTTHEMSVHVRKNTSELTDTIKCKITHRELPKADWCILFVKQPWEVSEASAVQYLDSNSLRALWVPAFIKHIPSSSLSLSPPPNGIIYCSLILFARILYTRPLRDRDHAEETDNWFHQETKQGSTRRRDLQIGAAITWVGPFST